MGRASGHLIVDGQTRNDQILVSENGMITFPDCPKQPRAKDVIAYLNALGVRVFIGHSDAPYEEVNLGEMFFEF